MWSQHKERQREAGEVTLQLQSHITYDRCCGLKTDQHSRSLQTHIPILHFLFLSAFLSVIQYVPQAVNSGVPLHSSVTLASALPDFAMLRFLSPPLPMRTSWNSLRILSFPFCLLKDFPYFCSRDSCSISFLPKLLSCLHFLMFTLCVITLPHPPLLLRVSTSISTRLCCLLGMVSCHLCFMMSG